MADENLTLPDPEELSSPTTTEDTPTLSTLGISSSAPAIDRADIESQVRRETRSAKKALKGAFAGRISELERERADTSRALEGQLGTRRRFSTSAQAYIANVDDRYRKQIGDLEAQRDEALANADMEMFQIVDSRVKEARNNWRAEIDDAVALYDLQDKMGGGDESQIMKLMAQGVTNPADLYQKLGGNVSTASIKATLDNLKTDYSSSGGFRFDTKGVSSLLGKNFSMDDIQHIQDEFNNGASISEILAGVSDPADVAAVKEALGVDAAADLSSLTPGVGAKDAMDEYAIRTRLFPKVAAVLNKGTLSDTDRAVIDERINYFRDNGYSEQQIIDTVWGWSNESPYNSRFQDIILANADDGEDITFTTSRVGSLLDKGAYNEAANAIENFALDKSKKIDPDGYFGKTTTTTLTRKIDRIKQLLKEGEVVGFVEGNFEKVKGQIKGKDATRIRAELTDLYSEFRKQNAGVSVTDSETKWLTPLLADIGDPKGNFLAKLDTFQTGILDRYNATRSTASLPKVRVLDILDDNERTRLYVGTSTFNGKAPPEL